MVRNQAWSASTCPPHTNPDIWHRVGLWLSITCRYEMCCLFHDIRPKSINIANNTFRGNTLLRIFNIVPLPMPIYAGTVSYPVRAWTANIAGMILEYFFTVVCISITVFSLIGYSITMGICKSVPDSGTVVVRRHLCHLQEPWQVSAPYMLLEWPDAPWYCQLLHGQLLCHIYVLLHHPYLFPQVFYLVLLSQVCVCRYSSRGNMCVVKCLCIWHLVICDS